MPRLHEIDHQCAATIAATPPNAHLIDENLRGYVVLLSAHFQGFCRDLYTECAQVIVARIRPSLKLMIQEQFAIRLRLDGGNPTHEHLKEDFKRFGFKLDLGTDSANLPRLAHLSALNKWRNVAAHQGTTLPAGIPLNLLSLRAWRTSRDELATVLDGIMYNELRRRLRRMPW